MRSRYRKFLLCLAATLCCGLTFGQNKISGRVTDAATGESLPHVNVFFANTTLGTSTNLDGSYAFSGFPPGKYDFTVSLLGYKRQQQTVELNGQSNLIINFQLEQDPVQLSEVVVKEDTAGRKVNFEQFKKRFLGRSDYSQYSVIQNPQDIHLYFDKQTSTLIAHAKKPIEVINRQMGYRIIYYLELFEYHYKPGLLYLYGLPAFESLTPKNSREAKKWERARAKAYQGSLMHFVRAWQADKLIQEGYKVSRSYKVANSRRPPDDFLNKKITALAALLVSKNEQLKRQRSDSLRYYRRLMAAPKQVDSVVNESLNGFELFSPEKKQVSFSGALVVEYKDKEELGYARYSGREVTVKQKSQLNILAPIKLYGNGYFEDVHDLLLEKYWAWVENISTLLPLDYYPTQDK